MIASKKICDILVETNIKWVFGVPGGSMVDFFDALYDYQDKINVVLARSEQQASIMADAYGRITGEPAVLACQGAFIGTTGAFGILNAYLSNSPMIVLTDFSEKNVFTQHGITQCGVGEYGSFDLRNILSSISKYVSVAVTPKEAVQGVQYAIKHATAERKGPACVIMRRSAITEEVYEDRIPRIYETKKYLWSKSIPPLATSIEEVAELLSSAKKPIIIAGNGVHSAFAYDELISLAELMNIPVTTSYLGKSTIPETHPLSVGMMGRFGQPLANKMVGEADTILVVGCSLSPDDTCFEDPLVIDPKRQKIIQIDIDNRNIGWVYPVDIGIQSDAKLALRSLVKSLSKRIGSVKENRKDFIEDFLKRKERESFFESKDLYSENIPILPQRVIKELNNILDESSMIFCDAGDNRLWTTHFFKTKSTHSFFGTGGIAGMGWGIPSAIVGKMLYPNKSCVAICGDGGFGMSMHSLMTAVQYSVPIIVVVMDNSALGMIRDAQKERLRGREIASDLNQFDIVKISEGIGCKGYKVINPNEIGPALKEAIGSKVPSVLDIKVSREENVYKKILFKP